LFAQVRNNFLLSLHCLRRCYTVFFIANIVCSGAAHIFQDLHCCTIHRCYTTRLYKSCSDCSATQLSSNPVSFAPVLHSYTVGTAMFAQVLDNLLQAQHCLLRCYTAFFRTDTVRVCTLRCKTVISRTYIVYSCATCATQFF
jgi:hypothetical protein